MAIVPKPVKKNESQSQSDFILGAPDAKLASAATDGEKKPRGAPRKDQKKVQLSMSMDATLLGRLDAKAKKLGQTRAALFNMAVYHLLENGIEIEG